MKFNDPNERRDHCIDVHKYPKNCRFDDTSHRKGKENDGNKMDIDIVVRKEEGKQKIRLNKNQKIKTFDKTSKMSNVEKSSATCPTTFTNINENASLMFVPRQVEKSYATMLSKNQSKKRNVLEAECMSDIAQSLPD